MALSVTLKKFFAELLMYGHDSTGVPKQLFLEDTGEAKVSLHGKDSAGNIDPLRTNANQQLQVEVVGSSLPYAAVGTAFSNPSATTNTNVYTQAAGTAGRIIGTTVSNRSASTAIKVRIGIDVDGNGTNTPSDAEWLIYDLQIEPDSTLFIDNIFWMDETDDLVVYTDNATASFSFAGENYTK